MALPVPDTAPSARCASPEVTIVVSPRERFSVARESLLSIYGTVGRPVELIYVDAGGGPELSQWLEEQAESRAFRLVRPGHFVTPHEAHNIGLRLARTEFVVFIDNDVICAPGWLDAMLDCARQENADVVTPLICHGLPLHTTIHHAGGKLFGDIEQFLATPMGTRTARDDIRHASRPIQEVAHELRREATETCEFHCLLMRRAIFDRIEPLDEQLLATREHVDLCLSVARAGGRIVFEPSAVVTYLFPSRQRPMQRHDWHYFLLRWSPQWQQRSIRRFETKWGLAPDQRMASTGWLNWRLHEGVAKPLIRRIPGTARYPLLSRVCAAIIGRGVRLLSRGVVAQDDWRRQRVRRQPKTALDACPSATHPAASNPQAELRAS